MKYSILFGFILSLLWIFPCSKSNSAENAFIVCPSENPPSSVRIGINEIDRVLTELGWAVRKKLGTPSKASSTGGLEIVVATFSRNWSKAVEYDVLRDVVPSEDESYSVLLFPNKNGIRVYAVGIDEVGTMYAAFDVAEQIELGKFRNPQTLQIEERKRTPSILYRGINLMIHTQALDDPVSWFHNELFWKDFLLVLAKSRFNFLDLHGAYDLMTTQFPNLLPYLIHVPDFESVGVGPEKAERNLTSLLRIIRMAHNHGIKVSLINYNASWSIPGNPGPQAGDETLKTYTLQALQKFLSRKPELDGIGFRVGESGQPVEFYQNTYIPALRDAKITPTLFTRTWMVKKKEIQNLVNSYHGNTVLEIKFNGEHLTLPYPVTGGRMTEWPGYSYETYLNLPRKYGILFQLAANATHRIFPWADYDFVRQTLNHATYGGANGFVIETYSTYFPHSDAYTNTNQADLRYYTWTFERDWFWYLLWGRLAYHRDEPEELFQRHFEHHFNSPAGLMLYDALKGASKVVPSIAAVCNPGPAKRNMAPELDPPKRVSEFLKIQPLDTFAYRSVADEAHSTVTGGNDGRLAPQTVLSEAVVEAKQAVITAQQAQRQMLNSLPKGSPNSERIKRYRECRAWMLDIQALEALGRYYRDKVQAAINMGIFLETGDLPSLMIAREKVGQASTAWNDLSTATEIHYRPFLDTLRTGTPQFHWNLYEPNAELDLRELTLLYNNWLQTWQENATLGHLRIYKAPPNQPILLTVSIPTNSQADRIYANYQNSSGIAGRLTMEPSRLPGVYYAEIPGRTVLEGVFQYFFFGSVNSRSVSAPGRNENPFAIIVTSDNQPPVIINFEHDVENNQVAVRGEFNDPSGVAVAKIFWKPLPSGETWSENIMQRVGDVFTTTFPITPTVGAQFAAELTDRFGNTRRIPELTEGIPYITVYPAAR